jgi:hypothetical protein
MKKKLIIFLVTIYFFPIFANESNYLKKANSLVTKDGSNSESQDRNDQDEGDDQDDFWLCGPLFASSATTTAVGTIVTAPYLIYYQTYGIYDENWDFIKIPTLNSLNPFCLVQTGLTDSLDVTFYFQAFENWKKSSQYFGFGDSAIRLKYCVFEASKKLPNIALFLEEIFPTGSYHHLSPDFFTLDGTGGGAYVTSLGIYLDDAFKSGDNRWFKWYLNLIYNFASTVSIEGLSIYGGGRGTRGTVKPGNSFIAIAAFERQITQNWVLALDVLYKHTNKSTFSGYPGVDEIDEVAFVGLPSSESLSIAPAIEYNIDSRKGITFGVWFSTLGRYAPAFVSPILSCYFTY